MEAELRSALPKRVCGKPFHPRALRTIREIIAEHSHFCRKDVAREVCARLDWNDPCGRPKVASAMAVLIRFHRKGWIELPAPRHGGVTVSSEQPLPEDFHPPGSVMNASLGALGEVKLQPVSGREQTRLWNGLISRYHYRGYALLAGAQIRYLLHSDRGVLGAMSYSAAALALRDRDRWIGWDREQRQANRHLIANNSRFLILPWVRVAHLASHVLAQASRRLPGDFQRRYGYAPVLLESFVEQGRFKGTCYRAANWRCVGRTSGRGRTDLRPWRQRRQEAPPLPAKSIWLYPLGPEAKVRARLCRSSSQPAVVA